MIGFVKLCPRVAIALFAIVALDVLGSSSSPVPLNLGVRSNSVGNAGEFGYARLVRSLGVWELSDGLEVPIFAEFSSKPSVPPSALGSYWSLPFFDSQAYIYTQNYMLWVALNGERYFFIKSASQSKQVVVFMEAGLRWKATVKGSKIEIVSQDYPGWIFTYDSGRLGRFQLGKANPECSIEYGGRGGVHSVREGRSGGDLILSVDHTFRGGHEVVEAIRVGSSVVAVGVEEAELIDPETGKLDDYQLLHSLGLKQGVERYSYKVIPPEGEGDVALNRLMISSGGSEDAEDFVEWDAVSGFIVSDSGAFYSIKNDSYDPRVKNTGRKTRISPEKVNFKRTSEDGGEQIWAYDWRSGEKIYSDASGLRQIRELVIMAPGASYLKTRKKEMLGADGKWELVAKYTYDKLGRISRVVQNEGLSVFSYEEGFYSISSLNDGRKIKGVKQVIRNGDSHLEVNIFDENGALRVKQLKGLDEAVDSYFDAYGLLLKKVDHVNEVIVDVVRGQEEAIYNIQEGGRSRSFTRKNY